MYLERVSLEKVKKFELSAIRDPFSEISEKVRTFSFEIPENNIKDYKSENRGDNYIY